MTDTQFIFLVVIISVWGITTHLLIRKWAKLILERLDPETVLTENQ